MVRGLEGTVFGRHRMKPRGGEDEITLSGEGWTGDLWREVPVRVPRRCDVGEFLSRRPLPYLWPDDAEYRAYVDIQDDPAGHLRFSWIDAFLHHPDGAVVTQCLREAFTGSNIANLTSVADLLGSATAEPQVKEEAARAVWRVPENGVRWVLNVLLSRGLFPSDYTALSIHQALGHLRTTCPSDRDAWLESELTGPGSD